MNDEVVSTYLNGSLRSGMLCYVRMSLVLCVCFLLLLASSPSSFFFFCNISNLQLVSLSIFECVYLSTHQKLIFTPLFTLLVRVVGPTPQRPSSRQSPHANLTTPPVMRTFDAPT